MNGKVRLGIFGGTFNPPHIGHVESAKSFIEALALDKLLIIPTFIPPHKVSESAVTPQDRLDMCALAFTGIDKTEVSDIEIKRGGKSYTYLTLNELYNEDTELFLLCGTDMLLTMDTWMHPEIIFARATICYARRESDEQKSIEIDRKISLYKEKYGAEIVLIDTSVIEISSSEIRWSVKNSESYVDFLPDAVRKFITDRELYK